MGKLFEQFGHIVTIVGMLTITSIAVTALNNGADMQLVTTCLIAIVALALGRWPLTPTSKTP